MCEERATKRLRLEAEAAPLAPEQSNARLDSLPAELLVMVLEHSLEPSLMLVNRRLHSVLPSYLEFTKDLAIKALLPAHTSDNLRVRNTDPRLDAHLANLELSNSRHMQERIRKAVFSSSWFGQCQLHHVHRRLFMNAVLIMCIWHSADGPSRGQMRRIRAFLDQVPDFEPVNQLNIRLRDEKRRPLNLISTPLTVALSAQHTTSSLTPVSFPILDFGGIIPDDLLRQPLTTNKLKLIQHISDVVARGKSDIPSVSCNKQLLREAFIDSIIHNKAMQFFALFTLEALLDTEDHTTVVNFQHLESAVVHGRTRFLIAIVKNLWAYPRHLRPSDGDLIDLINRAKSNGYPEWPKTTRILAMETASMWKAAEVEDGGGHVSSGLIRDFHG